MSNYALGFLGIPQAGVEAINDITVCVRNWYQNLNPLVTRLANIPVDRTDFKIYVHPYRPGSTTLTTTISSNATTTLVLADTTSLMNHDILQLIDSATGNSEYVQVNGDPTDATHVTVVRGVCGTMALSSITGGGASKVNLVGNSRQGDEITQSALTSVGTGTTQYCQTFQFPVAVGGSAETTRAAVLPGGIQSPFGFQQTMQLQNLVNSIETSFMYGLPQAPVAPSTTACMAGVRSLVVTNFNNGNGAAPANAGAYSSTDFVRDTLQACRQNGGDPDILFVASNFMSGFSTWGHAVQRLSAGESVFGTPIKILKAPFLDDVTIVEAPLLRPFSAFCTNTAELYTRWKRNIFWNQWGIRGDRIEGEWLAEVAIQMENEQHHAWVEGISAFSPN
jgi:hypothetical protein